MKNSAADERREDAADFGLMGGVVKVSAESRSICRD